MRPLMRASASGGAAENWGTFAFYRQDLESGGLFYCSQIRYFQRIIQRCSPLFRRAEHPGPVRNCQTETAVRKFWSDYGARSFPYQRTFHAISELDAFAVPLILIRRFEIQDHPEPSLNNY